MFVGQDEVGRRDPGARTDWGGGQGLPLSGELQERKLSLWTCEALPVLVTMARSSTYSLKLCFKLQLSFLLGDLSLITQQRWADPVFWSLGIKPLLGLE